MIITAEKNKEISEKLAQVNKAVIDGCYVVNRDNAVVIGCDTAQASRLIDAIMYKIKQSKKL